MELKTFASRAVDLASRLGLDDIELLLTRSHTLKANIENRDVTLQLRQDIFNAGLRVMKDGRLGYVPTTEPDIDVLRTGINAALARAAEAPFPGFAVASGPKDLKTWDPKVAVLLGRPARVRDLARDIIDRAYRVRTVENVEGSITVTVEERLVTTMRSPQPVDARRTAFSAFVEIDSKDFDFAGARNLPDLTKVAGLGAKVARSLPARSTTPGKEGVSGRTVPVIIHPVMLEGIIRNLVCEHAYATTVQHGMSRYAVGDTVASPSVTLHDDATAPWSGGTFPTDDEGTASRRTTVIDGGVLRTLLYDRASAARDRVESTGNGLRRPVLIEEPHEAPVRCSANDLFLAPGRTPLSRMVGSIKAGVLVKYLLGFHTANRTTGDFTNALYLGRVIRGGKIIALPEPGAWSVKGNALDLLKNVTAISRETLDTGSGVLPWLQTELAIS